MKLKKTLWFLLILILLSKKSSRIVVVCFFCYSFHGLFAHYALIMVSHLECAAATVWETAILISIRLCLSSLSTHKSLLQSEINSYWSALISQVRHEGDAATGTGHRSRRRKHHFVCEIAVLCGASPPLTLTGRMMARAAADPQSAGQQPHIRHTPLSQSKTTHKCSVMMIMTQQPQL